MSQIVLRQLNPLLFALPKVINSAARQQGLFSAACKRAFDLGAAVVALMLLFPLLMSLWMIVLVVQGRPVLFRHQRVGKNGKTFPCYKFRTMAVEADSVLRRHLASSPDASAEWEATHKLRDDPRVTELGRVLRKSSVDELPQIFNVLRGEMSLVGPRPIVLDEIHHYGADFAYYIQMRPGLTGLWQVSGRNGVSYAGRVAMDVQYVKNWRLRHDFIIIAKTIPAVLKAEGCS